MKDSQDISLVDYQALAEFRYQIRKFLRFSDEAAREAGVEPQQHQLMLALKGMQGVSEATIGDIADRLQIQHHSAVELLQRLEEKDLVLRSRGEQDRREVHVRLTTQGERIVHNLSVHHRNELRSTAPALVASLQRLSGANKSRTPNLRKPKKVRTT